MESDKLLNFNVGEIGQKKSWVPPDNLLKAWAPSGLSLEEIEKRREVLRKIQRDITSQSTGYGASISSLSSGNVTLVTVPKNKTYYIYALQLGAAHIDVDTTAYPYVALFSVSNGIIRDSLMRLQLMYRIAGMAITPQNLTLSLPVPYKLNENEALRVDYVNFHGVFNLVYYFWEEDKDIIL